MSTTQKKYQDFVEAVPVQRRGKFPPHAFRSYVDITCPHCNEVCAEIPEELVKMKKASECLKHLRVCASYEGSVSEAPEKKRKYTNEDIMREVQKVRTEMKQMEERICRTVAEHVELDPPPPQTEEDLNAKLARQRQRQLSVNANVRNLGERAEGCTLCLQEGAVVDALIVPCMHRASCWECWTSWAASRQEAHAPLACPLCRVEATTAVRLAREG